MQLDDRIRALGNAFVTRLDAALLSSATDYVNFGENALAIEMICDHLFEYGIEITEDEFQEIFELSQLTAADPGRVALLKAQVRHVPI